MEYRFNDKAVENGFDQLIKVEGVDEYSLTNNAAEEIEDILSISTMLNAEDVRAVRNSVVKIFGKKVNEALGLDEHGNKIGEDSFKDYKYWNMWLSAITSVCDRKIWRLGGEV